MTDAHNPKLLSDADAAADLAGVPRPVSSADDRALAERLAFWYPEREESVEAADAISRLVSERDALAVRVSELEGNSATIAGLECAVGHLSTMVDEQRRLLVEVEQVCGRDAYGMEFEDGDSELIDKVRAHLAATTDPDAALPSKEQP